jgi:hypothetical protein
MASNPLPHPLLTLLVALAILSTGTTAAAGQHRAHYYVEAGGSAGTASLNLDVRSVARLQLRTGVGLASLWPAVPLTASYLLGSSHAAFEIGGGATMMFFPPTDPRDPLGDRIVKLLSLGMGAGTQVVPSGILGYRLEQPGGFLLRVTATPFFFHGHTSMWAGVSLGGGF